MSASSAKSSASSSGKSASGKSASGSKAGAGKSAPKSTGGTAPGERGPRERPPASAPIVDNRRARFEYHLEEKHEAGVVLYGWEIKAIRAGQVQMTDGYVVIKNGELFVIGLRINALRSASTHVLPEPDRTKKLLMRKDEIRRLVGKVEQRGFTLVPLNLHYRGGLVKCDIALAKGKAQHDKRNAEKDRDWEREKGRLMRHQVSSPGRD
ncbi:SsrA-binding protein SmpB [Pseudaquabacterium rugosum]|jgi:SsrA-binding protein|uniref:SsrA-binding protein n=1 Tax=Pseudaquabacterium rugosum TaxID=2984194 RepID=A0ABU9BE19_9BURK